MRNSLLLILLNLLVSCALKQPHQIVEQVNRGPCVGLPKATIDRLIERERKGLPPTEYRGNPKSSESWEDHWNSRIDYMHNVPMDTSRNPYVADAPELKCIGSVSYTHLTLPTIYSV